MSEFIIEGGNLGKLRRLAGLHVKETLEMTSGKLTHCRDCAYICHNEYGNGLEYLTCSYFDSRYAEIEPDGFCAWGERRNA